MPHIHNSKGQFDFTVSVYVVYKSKVLLRKHDKYGFWLGVGGHVELNEDPNQAAIREVKEEVGLDIDLVNNEVFAPKDNNTSELVTPFHLNKHAINADHGHIDLIYYATSLTNKVTPEKPDDKWQWLSEEELIANKISLTPSIKFYALEALKIA